MASGNNAMPRYSVPFPYLQGLDVATARQLEEDFRYVLSLIAAQPSVFDAIIDPHTTVADPVAHVYPNLTQLLANETWQPTAVFNVGVRQRADVAITGESAGLVPPGHLALFGLGGFDPAGAALPWVWGGLNMSGKQLSCTNLEFGGEGLGEVPTFQTGGVLLLNNCNVGGTISQLMADVIGSVAYAFDSSFANALQVNAAGGSNAQQNFYNCILNGMTAEGVSNCNIIGGACNGPLYILTLGDENGQGLYASAFSSSLTINVTAQGNTLVVNNVGGVGGAVTVTVGSDSGSYANVTITGTWGDVTCNANPGFTNFDGQCAGLSFAGPGKVRAVAEATHFGIRHSLSGSGVQADLQIVGTWSALPMTSLSDSEVSANMQVGTNVSVDAASKHNVVILTGMCDTSSGTITNSSSTTRIITDCSDTLVPYNTTKQTSFPPPMDVSDVQAMLDDQFALPGPAGLAGAAGAAGATGATGAAGAAGLSGSPGPFGDDGAEGEQGFPGVQGKQGVQGLTGSTGATGAQGLAGVPAPYTLQQEDMQAIIDDQMFMPGPQGATGATGATGPAGSSGSALATPPPFGDVEATALISETDAWTPPGVPGQWFVGASAIVTLGPVSYAGLVGTVLAQGITWNTTGGYTVNATAASSIEFFASGLVVLNAQSASSNALHIFTSTGVGGGILIEAQNSSGPILVQDNGGGITIASRNSGQVQVSSASGADLLLAAAAAGSKRLYIQGVVVEPHGGSPGNVLMQQTDGSFTPQAITESTVVGASPFIAEADLDAWQGEHSEWTPPPPDDVAMQDRSMPAGSIIMFGGATAPLGYVLCDGTSYLRTALPALFGAIGTAFGSVDGSHFTVPNLQEVFPLGAGATHAVGATGGATTHTHTIGSVNTVTAAAQVWTYGASSGTAAAQGWTQSGIATAQAQAWTATGSHTHPLSSAGWAKIHGVSGSPAEISELAVTGITSWTSTQKVSVASLAEAAESTARTAATGLGGATDATTITGTNAGSQVTGIDGTNVPSAVTGVTGTNATSAVTGTADPTTGPIDPFVTVNYLIKT